ncbi:MAG TPA: hypothetical protein PLE82_05405 [Saccharofermentans sp.]|nr:hypothetical protein [Saccharofermentans sp.]
MNESIDGIYSIVDRADVAAKVEVPHGGISAITLDCHDTFQEVIFATAARYIRVVVTKYSDLIPLPSPCDAVAIQRFAFCEPVPVTAWFHVVSTQADTEFPDATVSAARRLY